MKSKDAVGIVQAEDGLDIFYWINYLGRDSKGFKVLHPGASMNHSSLLELESGINQRGYSTVVFDPRGTGFSVCPAEAEYFALEKYSSDLARIVEKEGIQRPEIVGHSMGFMPAVDYAANNENVGRIVGICGSYKFSETSANESMFEVFNKFLRYSEYLGSLATGAFDLVNGRKRRYPDQSKLVGKNEFDVWLSIVNQPFEAIKRNIVSGQEMSKWDILDQLAALENDLLLIYGRDDDLVKPVAGTVIFSQVSGSRCDLKLVKGTHSLPVTNLERILEAMF